MSQEQDMQIDTETVLQEIFGPKEEDTYLQTLEDHPDPYILSQISAHYREVHQPQSSLDWSYMDFCIIEDLKKYSKPQLLDAFLYYSKRYIYWYKQIGSKEMKRIKESKPDGMYTKFQVVDILDRYHQQEQ